MLEFPPWVFFLFSPSSLIPHLNTLNAPPTSYHDPLYHKISSPSPPIHFNTHPFCYYSACHCNLYNSVFFINSSPEHPSNHLDIIHPDVLYSIGFVPYVYTIIAVHCCVIAI